MGLESDIRIDASKFSPANISEHTKKYNAQLIKMNEGQPKWYEVGAERARQMRLNGETPFPPPVLLERGKKSSIPSRDSGRDIPTRVWEPANGKPKAVYMHIHGGGWVLMSEEFHDPMFQYIVDKAQVTLVSIGYRLSPEHPYPAPTNDCYDAAEWLVDNAKSTYGAELAFVGGESAGGHLSACVTLHLLKARPNFSFKGAILHYGAYDIGGLLPQAHNFCPQGTSGDKTLVLDLDIMQHFLQAFLPNTTEVQRRDPAISPLYADLRKIAAGSKGGLPPVLFTCGSEDNLLDDTVFFSAKWMMAGGEAIVKIFPGAPHGYTLMPIDSSEDAKKGNDATVEFMSQKLA